MPADKELIEDLMEYIKMNYKLATKEFVVPNGVSGEETQIVHMTFSELLVDAKKYVKQKRSHLTFLLLLEKYKNERNMTDSELYNKARLDRRHYFKMVKERFYHPAKKTVIALGMALELTRKDMDTFLRSCGFALNEQSVFDLVVMFCIDRRIFNIFDINVLLLELQQEVLVKG
jgi:hypothetical protein